MELREGYKQTEVGVIPEAWDAPELGAILKSTQLGGNYKNNECVTNWPLIKMGNLGRGTIKLDKLEFIIAPQPPAIRDRLKEDDVLFNTRNTLELVGKIAIWRNELPEAYFNSNIMRMEFNETNVASKRFMNYILNTRRSLKSLRAIAIGTTSVAAIYSRDLVKVKIPVPTKSEQIAIANALSDADALIQSLTRLIAKKCQIKQGAMQTLLNPYENGRLKAGWVVKKLGDVADITAGGDLRVSEFSKIQNDQYPYPIYSNAHTKKGLYGFCRTSDYNSKAVTITARGGIGYAVSRDNEFCAIGRLLILQPYHEYSCEYISEYINLKIEFANESTGVPQLTAPQVSKYEIFFPNYKEQTRIASILSDMDADITALETKLTKTQQIKQGMMQNLLTGRIRLI
ncbi:MAG: hypothetical protein GXP14_07620 [Gammaproteobacteria bacterium]|nr:hypothetical protein [Gammaproteobacteria bacterium]